MTRLLSTLLLSLCALAATAQGWPAQYGGVMLQGFYWDSFRDTKWTTLEQQATELGRYFSLLWLPQSGNCNGRSMGYNPLYYWDQNSSFGTEAELRSLIAALKANGCGTIADVVINHRCTLSNWVDFPAETYRGETYQMLPSDICHDDDGGKTLTWATQNGYTLSANNDEGEGWDGFRDLDHRSTNVQRVVKAYERYLLNDLGYVGFRYDVAKGFAASHIGDYNAASGPQFSVGEVWDGTQTIKTWIDGTRVGGQPQSAAFDFQFRYRVRDAINARNWGKLAESDRLVVSGSTYCRYAVTFLENHDTELRSSSEQQDPLRRDTLATNAFLLAMPGTPCVFLKHWQAYRREIKLMIEARRLAGITNESAFSCFSQSAAQAAFNVTGTHGQLLVVVGDNAASYTRAGYTPLLDGYHFRYLVKDVDTASWAETVARIEAESVEPPTPPFADRDITIHVATDLPQGYTASTLNFWVWSDTDHSNLCTRQSWPGDRVTTTTTVGGRQWAYRTYRVTAANRPISLVISAGSGSPQTVDITDIESDKYYVVSPTKQGGKNTATDVTAQYTTSIAAPVFGASAPNAAVYNLSGQRVNTAQPLRPGLYIKNGHKTVIAR